MAIDTDQVRVGVTGSVYVAPLATALPDEPDEALDVAFVDLGATNEDAFEITPSQTIEKIRAWQSSKPVRVVKTEDDLAVSFTLIQMNADTLPLAFGGGTISATVGLASKFVPPAAGTVDERAFIFEWVDGDYTYRLCVPRGMVSETDSIPVKKDEAISLPLTVEVLGSSPDDFFILTDDPAFA
jgi:hypothetical protein